MTEPLYLISEEALTDLTEIALWYERQSLFLSDNFLNDFYNVSLKAICSNPYAYIKYFKSANIRRYKMKKFPYKIFYDSKTFPVEIIAVIHTSRSSGYIKRRLK